MGALLRRSVLLVTQVCAVFQTLDTDGDGSISAKELRKGLRRFGYALSDAEVGQLLSRMDLNRDGRCACGLAAVPLAQRGQSSATLTLMGAPTQFKHLLGGLSLGRWAIAGWWVIAFGSPAADAHPTHQYCNRSNRKCHATVRIAATDV